jgi:hypothetical protein
MAYPLTFTPFSWADLPLETTPVNKADLQEAEKRLAKFAEEYEIHFRAPAKTTTDLNTKYKGETVAINDVAFVESEGEFYEFTTSKEWVPLKVGEQGIKEGAVSESRLAEAVKTLLNQKSSGLAFTKQNVSAEAASGKLYYMESNGLTLTLPAATTDRLIGVICGNGVPSTKLKLSAGKLYGDFISGVTEVTLTENQHLIVHADGTNWRIESGEPKRTQAYSAAVHQGNGVSKEYEASAARPAFISVIFSGENAGRVIGELQVGGKKVASVNLQKSAAGNPVTTVFAWVPPSVQYAVSNGEGTESEITTVLL